MSCLAIVMRNCHSTNTVRYMIGETGEISTQFLAAHELPGTNAGDNLCVMRKTMLDYNLFISNLGGFATDGASVVVSQ